MPEDMEENGFTQREAVFISLLCRTRRTGVKHRQDSGGRMGFAPELTQTSLVYSENRSNDHTCSGHRPLPKWSSQSLFIWLN